MTDFPAAKAAFAPVWPFIYKAPIGRQVIPPYKRVRVFNRDLSIEELAPLSEGFPAPGRTLRRIGYCTFAGICLLHLGLWILTLLTALIFLGIDVSESEEQTIAAFIKDIFNSAASLGGSAISAAIVLGVAGTAVDYVAWKKWAASLTATWELYEGRLLPINAVPDKRRPKSDKLCRRLDSALKKMDANNAGARLMESTARDALGSYLELPVISKESRAAISSVDEVLVVVQKVRELREAAAAAESAALMAAEDAVLSIEGYTSETKAASTEKRIIESAQTITVGESS